MEFQKVQLEAAQVKMDDVPVLWAPPHWTYGKDCKAEQEAKEARVYTERSRIGELQEHRIEEFQKEWKGLPHAALVVGTGTDKADVVEGTFWVSTEPFVHVETSAYKCPVCSTSVFYCASTGWSCDSCGKVYGRSSEPAFMIGKSSGVEQ